MKKFLLLLILLLSIALPALAEETHSPLSVGSTFVFGSFEQDNNLSNGTEPIEWLVLKNDGHRALLISKQILTCQPFHTSKEAVAYQDSSLRTYLNNEFIQTAFNTAEQSAIMTAFNNNAPQQGNPTWDSVTWSNTYDRVFVLSFKETEAYFPDKAQRQAIPTEYAKHQGTITLVLPHMDYWIRSWGNTKNTACMVNIYGDYNAASVTDKKGIRPVLYLNLNSKMDSFQAPLYEKACTLRDAERFAEAIPLFDSLGNYRDSLAQSQACRAADTTALHVGFYYTFGQYEQDNNTKNGNEPIEWLVLENDGETALLISRHVLDCQPFATDTKYTEWVESSLREWLNSTFLENAFTEAERAALIQVQVENGQNQQHPDWTRNYWSDTSDSVFLLSYAEADKLLTLEQRKSTLTEYARAQGAALPLMGNSDFYLRSNGKTENEACMVNIYGDYVSVRATDKKGIRPVIRLDLSASESTFAKAQYNSACALWQKGAYYDAASIFDSIGNYQDSELRAQKCRYSQAEIERYNQNFDAAIALYEQLGTYSDSYDLLGECRYEKGVFLQNSGDFQQALTVFSKLGNYHDSIHRMTQCMNRLGIRIRYMNLNAINTGIDNGYSKSNVINGNDPHFGWRLGRFFMTNFTRVNDDTDQPVFIKTLGDKVTLWYELEQDITQLDGKNNLSISADTNGYDEYFGIKRTNFGRGVLVVRQTDYQNNQKESVIYTDYLAATDSHGAITSIEFLDEGDYEVALNYEIMSNGVIDSFNNYRVFFRFSVRNGNCMIYPFDISTGSELTNSSIAPNGFYLDLARSRYLDINVKRSVLSEGAVGLTEDRRFNRPAKDGDRYTQEGVYTIDVSNRYTGESTTKTIFVGSEETLQKYVELGFVLP